MRVQLKIDLEIDFDPAIGSTRALDGSQPECGDSEAWAVSLNNCEKRFRREPSPDEIGTFISDHWKELIRPNRFLGNWIYATWFYLDVSMIVSDFEEALKIGRMNRQIAIYDLRRDVNVYLHQPENLRAAFENTPGILASIPGRTI